MRCTALQSFAVLHQRLDRQGILGSRETFAVALVPDNDGNGQPLFGKIGIDTNHLLGFGDRLLTRFMRGMPLLPQEFGRTQEQARTHFPAHDIGPLVTQNRQVAVRLYPIFIGIPDNRFGSRAHDQLLFQFRIGIDHDAFAVRIILQAIMRHYRALFGKALHMVGLLAEKGLGDKQREIGIFMAGLLEHRVQLALHLLPNRVTVRFDHHAPPDGRPFGQTRFYHQIVIPLRVVLFPRGQLFQLFCHNFISFCFV